MERFTARRNKALLAVALALIALPLSSVANPFLGLSVAHGQTSASYHPSYSENGQSCVAAGRNDCYYSASPASAFNFLGQVHTETFTCGEGVGFPTDFGVAYDRSTTAPGGGPAAAGEDVDGLDLSHSATLDPGCYDVTASVSDEYSGSSVQISSSTCGYVAGTAGWTPNCASYASPLCAYGATTPTSGDACSQRDTGQFRGSTMTISFTSGAPHQYLITFTGYTLPEAHCTGPGTGTGYPQDNGKCPTGAGGTTPYAAACPSGSTFLSGPFTLHIATGHGLATGVATSDGVCKFTVQARKSFISISSVTLTANCGTQVVSWTGWGPSCRVAAVASGRVVLSNFCYAGISGTHVPDYTIPEPTENQSGATYQCVNGQLTVSIPDVEEEYVNAASPTGLGFKFTATGPGGMYGTYPGAYCHAYSNGTIGPVNGSEDATYAWLCPTGRPGAGTIYACAVVTSLIDAQPTICSNTNDP